MSALMFLLNVLIALLATVNTISWGYAIREVGDLQLTLGFLIRLMFNRWFILAMGSAFIAALLSYIVFRTLGILVGRFFLSLNIVAIVLAGTFILGEQLTLLEWIGIALIIIGIILLGKSSMP